MPESTQQSIDDTDVIFAGSVEDVRADGEMGLKIYMNVSDSWKGLKTSEKAELTLKTNNNSAACGYTFEEDEEYLVYASRSESGGLNVSLCSATKLVKNAEEDLKLLEGDSVACTMDAKVCPDGSYVGRQGPNCEFAACPGEAQNCSPYKCKDGTEVARCSEDGHVINYFAAPCHANGGEVEASFSDVSSAHPNADAIAYVKAEGVVQGYSDGTYKPNQTINRAEFVKVLLNAIDIRETIKNCRYDLDVLFSDTPFDAWYFDDVCIATIDRKIINGYPDGTFRPAQNVNFVEAAKMITTAYDLASEWGGPSDPWHKKYVEALADKNAIPISISSFDQKITRGEMAEMMYRLEAKITTKPSRTFAELQGR